MIVPRRRSRRVVGPAGAYFTRGREICGLAGLLTLVLLAAACSASTKRQWLTFFFDGVPREPSAAPATQSSSSALTNRAPAAAARVVASAVLHQPYRERQCTACHESQFSQKLRVPAQELCLLCHKQFASPAPFAHAPAESGACLVCHEPHQSAESFLLTRPGQRLCRECHDQGDVEGVAAHAAIGGTPCQECHAPHGGDTRYYLRTTARLSPANEPGPPPAARAPE